MLYLILFLSTNFVFMQKNTEVIYLEGPRKPIIAISQRNEVLEVNLEMSPINCFEADLNNRINRQKADIYINHAIFRYLTGKNSGSFQSFSVENAIVKHQNKKYKYWATVPIKGLKFPSLLENDKVDVTKTQFNKPEIIYNNNLSSIKLFNIYTDYIETVKFTSDFLQSIFPDNSLKESDFSIKISDCEDQILANMVLLNKEIDQEMLLLDLEKEKIKNLILQEKEQLLEKLKRHYEKHRKI
jgi:hypothetical protein